MVRLAYLGMEPVELVEALHEADLAEMRSGESLTDEGKKKRGMYAIHFHQKINGIRRIDDGYLSRIEDALDLREGSMQRGRWTDLVSGRPDA